MLLWLWSREWVEKKEVEWEMTNEVGGGLFLNAENDGVHSPY